MEHKSSSRSKGRRARSRETSGRLLGHTLTSREYDASNSAILVLAETELKVVRIRYIDGKQLSDISEAQTVRMRTDFEREMGRQKSKAEDSYKAFGGKR